MINHQALREIYKPDKIKVLFIAEAPPENDTFFYSAKSFFYDYTKQIFNELFEDEINQFDEFLYFFQNKGCFLDDLCHEPKTYKEMSKYKNIYIDELKSRLKLYDPQAIIITPKEIDGFVREAIKKSNIDLDPELIFTLYFPGNGWQNEFMSYLWSILHFLIKNNILNERCCSR